MMMMMMALQIDVTRGISDHDVPVCVVPLGGSISTHSSVFVVTGFEKADDDSIQTHLAHELQHFPEMGLNTLVDVDSLWLHFKSVVLFLCHSLCTYKSQAPAKK